MILSFDDCEIDLERREFRRAGIAVHVEPQVFDLLAYLAQNGDRVVSKDEIFASVWEGRIVSDSTLTSRINAARKVVGDSGKEQRLIRTVARKGMRFVGDVRTQPDRPEPAVVMNSLPDATDGPTRAALQLPDRPAIAVLPFINMSGDLEQEYFSDGITEDIITDLSKFSQLHVIARNTAFTFKGRSMRIDQIARELGVRYVLEGSVRKAGTRIRVTGQLIDGRDGGHL